MTFSFQFVLPVKIFITILYYDTAESAISFPLGKGDVLCGILTVTVAHSLDNNIGIG